MLTKSDIIALRTADSLCVHLGKDYTVARAIKRNPKTEAKPFAQDTDHMVNCEISLNGSRGQDELKSGRVKCFALINLYHSQKHTATLILHTLRENDEITFRFYPDAHTNGYVAMSGLHADCLYMDVRRQGKTIGHWELQSSICPTNSARMVNGVPDSESYRNDAVSARKAVA